MVKCRAARGRRDRWAVALAASACSLIGPVAGLSAELSFKPRAAQEFFYNDNVGFTRDNEISSFGTTSSVGNQIGLRTRNLDFTLDTRVDYVNYFEKTSLNTDNEYVTLNAERRGERGQLTLTGTFVRDVARENLVNTTGNAQLNDERQNTFSFAPSYTYQLTRNQSLVFDASVERRVYPNLDGASSDGVASGSQLIGGGAILDSNVSVNPAAPLQNYTQYGGGVTWLTNLTPRVSTGVGLSTLYIDQAQENLALGSVQGIVQWQVTPRLSLNARAGPSFIETTTQTQKVDTVATGFNVITPNGIAPVFRRDFSHDEESEFTIGYLVDAGLRWQATQRTTVGLRYTRSITASASQGAATRDQIGVDLGHALLRDLRFNATGTFIRQDVVSSSSSSSERTSILFFPGVTWSVFSDLDLSLRYQFRYEEFGGGGSDALSNAVIFRVDLRLPELHRSW